MTDSRPGHRPGPAGRALAAAACTATGAVAVTVAVANGPSPGLASYVSEAGASTSPSVWTYRIGMLAVAGGLVLLATALPAVLRLASGLLAVSALATVVSAGVSCRSACPLPPFDRTTLADLVHGGASIAAVAGTVFAILTVALTVEVARPLRRLAVVAAVVAVPLSGAAGAALLVVGRGVLTGTVERLLLFDLTAWGVLTALTVGVAIPARIANPPDSAAPPGAVAPPGSGSDSMAPPDG